jgi:hypothetical protein
MDSKGSSSPMVSYVKKTPNKLIRKDLNGRRSFPPWLAPYVFGGGGNFLNPYRVGHSSFVKKRLKLLIFLDLNSKYRSQRL